MNNKMKRIANLLAGAFLLLTTNLYSQEVDMADTMRSGLSGGGIAGKDGENEVCEQAWAGLAEPCSVSHAAHDAALCEGIRRGNPAWWWRFEPDVGRVAHGVPSRVDRLKSLGNAVVPQIPEIIGRAILDANERNN